MKSLFEKTAIGSMSLKNRFFRGALWEELADEKGHLTPELIDIYLELAKGGVGTIITGYSFVWEDEQPNPRMMGIYDDSFIEEYKRLTDQVHQYDANIIMQIVYGGSMTTFNVGDRKIWGPSSHINDRTGTKAEEISVDEIKHLVDAYAKAAKRVEQAGFDGVELHAGHGYLLSQFLSPFYNKRTDQYGGVIHNRARIIYEIVEAIRKEVRADFPVLIKMNSQDFRDENGFKEEEAIEVAKHLQEIGISAIEVTGGDESALEVFNGNLGPARKGIARSIDRESYFSAFAARLASEVQMPIILIGGNRHFSKMEGILRTTNINYFSLSRPLTAEPDLINQWHVDPSKKPKCVSCNKCYFTEGKRCILNQKKIQK